MENPEGWDFATSGGVGAMTGDGCSIAGGGDRATIGAGGIEMAAGERLGIDCVLLGGEDFFASASHKSAATSPDEAM